MYDIIIPGEVAQSTLSTPCKYFYGELRGLAQRDGCVYASNAYLEKHCQLSEKQIQRNLRCLELCGFIHIDTLGKHRKIYISTTTPTKMSANPDKNVGQNKKVENNKDLYNILSIEHACAREQFPRICKAYEEQLARRELITISLASKIDMDAAGAIVSAYLTLPAYNIAYWRLFDWNKLSHVASAIKRKRVENIREYVSKSFAVPGEWQTLERINFVESELASA